jgi:catechol 2,3-dioxygenase
VLAEGGSPGGRWPGMPDGTRVGHVHLRVSHIDAAEQFYVGVLGFDLVQRYGRGALFVSAGGYHHHVGLNTWGGVGAPPPPQGAVGLRHADVRLPDAESLAQLVERLRDAGHPVRESPEGVEATDPSGNRLRFVTGHEPTPRA